MTAPAYPRIQAVFEEAMKDALDPDPVVAAYMLARFALLTIRARHGAMKAAELAYRLGDEFAGEGKP